MLVRCENCGAPLEVADTQRFTTCTYCGNASRVQSQNTAARPAFVDPLAPRQVVPEYIRQQPPQGEPAPRSSGGLGWLIALTGAIVAVGGAVGGYYVLSSGGSGVTILQGIDPSAPPTFGVTGLNTLGRTMFSNAGVIEGAHDAHGLGTGCRGWVPTAPTLTLRVTTFQYASITTAASEDLTMVLRDPSGHIHCDDDSGEGTNPRISTLLEPGTWTVWIGTFNENARAPYSLLVDAQGLDARPDATGLAPDATPTVTAVDLDRTPAGTTVGDMVSGLVDGRVLGTGCRGWFSPAPQVTVTTSHPVDVVLQSSGQSSTVLAVRTPQGLMQCGSTGSPLTVTIPRGRSGVWVGSTEEGHVTSFTLGVVPTAGATPPGTYVHNSVSDPLRNLTGPALNLGGQPTAGVIDLDNGHGGTVTSAVSAQLDLRPLGHGCIGYVAALPTAILQTTIARQVRIRATSQQDTVMLIRGSTGEIFCSDDADGTPNPRLDLTIPPGRHPVWIGTYSSGVPAVFNLSAQVLDAPPAAIRHGHK